MGIESGEHVLSKGTVRGIVVAYLLIFLGATTWPGATIYNQALPLVLGLPFNLFILALLIMLALVLLAALYISETRSSD